MNRDRSRSPKRPPKKPPRLYSEVPFCRRRSSEDPPDPIPYIDDRPSPIGMHTTQANVFSKTGNKLSHKDTS